MKNSIVELHQMNLTELNYHESENTSGGWLILLAAAIEIAALAIEVGSVALATDMIINPDRYKAYYQKGAAGN